MEQGEKKLISVSLLQAVAKYLATKPYNEVFGLLGGIANEANATPKPAQALEKEPKEAPKKK